ncbi:alpha/beta fold hydrolase [Enterovirga sp.]|uniref:PHA/PHB synthase family protein n=1 Tax=Enterovirga sp. TaxID=2026350 RepID=UPI002B5174B4|nr:alpha/beta fold hydrolase [Enterovirga sp.]HMO29472.1 alpha/beta fold hydrolase [Enterovirga sp.]
MDTKPGAPDPVVLGRDWAELAGKAQRAATKLAGSPASAAILPMQMAQDISASFGRFYAGLLRDPRALAEANVDFWRGQAEAWSGALRPGGEGGEKPRPKDRRFRNSEWEANPALRGLLHSYLVGADWMRSLAGKGELAPEDRKKVTFFTEQLIDAMAPSNFAHLNPDVVKKTVETGGRNLIQGFSNFLDDVLAESGHVRRADQEAFELGVTIAATKGSVVLRTPMMELIQYEPTTEKVSEVPLLLISPWVNKYYLFDLQPKTSFIRWALEQGYTVFAVSWVNPDESHAGKDFEDYWLEGPQAAFAAIAEATGQDKVNLIGYCLGGTLTASGLAYMAAKGDERANSATMIATMTDFADAGDFEVFVSNENVKALRAQLADKGYLSDAELSTLFSLLRANDLIWSSAISSYLLADKAVPSDLLFWFSDGIGMPGKMLETFMSAIMLDNALAKPGRLKLAGTPLDLAKIETPLCFVSLKDDHVANWETTYRGALRFTAPKRFILGGSGHNAGTINPPAAQKHGYWTNAAFPPTAAEWLAGAERHEGSWWSEWSRWLKERSGEQVPARPVAGGPLPVLEAAPGSYARIRR